MAKYRDVGSAGPSKAVPFKADEEPHERHSRRLDYAKTKTEDIKARCSDKGVSLSVFNYGHHWVFVKNENKDSLYNRAWRFPSVQWWPSSAKLIRDRRWRKGVHVHDIDQCLKVVYEHLLGEKQ